MGSEDRIEAEHNVYTLQRQISEKAFDDFMADIEDRKYFKQLSDEDALLEELAYWEERKNMAAEGSDDLKEAEKQIYGLRESLADEHFNHSMDWIAEEKKWNRLNLEGELDAYNRILAKEETTAEQRKEIEYEVYQVKQALRQAEYDNSMDWIEERKYYNEMTVADELAAYKRVLAREPVDSDKWKKTKKEIYRLEQDILKLEKENEDAITAVKADAEEKRKQLNADYYADCEALNDKLKKDIAEVDKAYADAVDSRAKSLYGSYGLFDEVKEKEAVEGSVLMKNLQAQIDELGEWREQLDSLSAKGVNEGLIDELQEMGPDSIAQIRALNGMTDGELAKYVTLWSDKHRQAKEQATNELEDMRIETQTQIDALTAETETALKALETAWAQNWAAILDDRAKSLAALKADYDKNFLTPLADAHEENLKKMGETEKAAETVAENVTTETGEMSAAVVEDFTEMTQGAVEVIKNEDWEGAGRSIVEGLSFGILKNSNMLMVTMHWLASRIREKLMRDLEAHSPSKVFARIGGYIDEGLAVGITEYASAVTDASASLGTDTVDALGQAIAGISDVLASDVEAEPVIRPVLDLTDVANGLGRLDGLTADRSLRLGASVNQNGGGSQQDGFGKTIEASNGKVVSAIEALEAKVGGLFEKVTRMQVVMDTGILVGAMAGPMDAALGGLSTMTRRGVR
jgi:hypothetical protein